MNETRPDVIKILEDEKAYYAEQIRRINIALAALKDATDRSETSSKTKQRKIQWTAEIRSILKEGGQYDTKELVDKLAERGIIEAYEDSGRNSIYSTLSRMKANDEIIKTEDEKFEIIKRKRMIRRRRPAGNLELKGDENADQNRDKIEDSENEEFEEI